MLRYVPTNLRGPEIAGELYVSLNTIRTHLRHLYAKLGTHRRADAVARARALGPLAPSPSRTNVTRSGSRPGRVRGEHGAEQAGSEQRSPGPPQDEGKEVATHTGQNGPARALP